MPARLSAPARPRWHAPLLGAALLLLIAGQFLGLTGSPPDVDMGHLQKIMYVHVPAAWSAFLAFFIVFVASVLYLWRGDEQHDLLAAAAAEIGTMMTALTLALGSIWARPTWGVWWTWDPRLTTTAILLLVFVGYLALRSFTEDGVRRARWSAAVGILGFFNVWIVYFSVVWWRTLHQPQSSPETVDAAYALGLRLNSVAFLVLFLYLLARRYYAAQLERAVEAALEEAALGEVEANV